MAAVIVSPASGLQWSVPSLTGWFLFSASATSWVVVAAVVVGRPYAPASAAKSALVCVSSLRFIALPRSTPIAPMMSSMAIAAVMMAIAPRSSRATRRLTTRIPGR